MYVIVGSIGPGMLQRRSGATSSQAPKGEADVGPVDSTGDISRAPSEPLRPGDSPGTPDRRQTDQSGTLRPSDNLRQRLDELPPGHPASPYETDGTPRQLAPRLRDLEIPDDEQADDWRSAESADAATDGHADQRATVTDAAWTNHVADTQAILEEPGIADLATNRQYTVGPDGREWSAERNRVQGTLVADLYKRADEVPCEHRAVIAGGLGGAGKTTVLGNYAGIDLSKYLTINPDDIKEEMARRGLVPRVEGLTPMEASELVHEESSHIAKRLALRATADGKNIIWDITMSTRESTEGRINNLRSAGYSVEGIFVDISVETSVRRADARHREGYNDYLNGLGLGGRYVPAKIIEAQADPDWGSKNRKTFEEVKNGFDRWSRYDNSVDGRPPVLVDTDVRHDANREEGI